MRILARKRKTFFLTVKNVLNSAILDLQSKLLKKKLEQLQLLEENKIKFLLVLAAQKMLKNLEWLSNRQLLELKDIWHLNGSFQACKCNNR